MLSGTCATHFHHNLSTNEFGNLLLSNNRLLNDGIIIPVVGRCTSSIEERRYQIAGSAIVGRSTEGWVCVGTLGHEQIYKIIHLEFSLLKPSASEGAVSYYAMLEVTQQKPEPKGTAVDMDPNRHRTQKSILCFRITETHNKKKKKRKVLQIMRSLVYLYETVTGFQRGRGCY